MGVFNWIRRSVKAAVVAGFQDAVNELQSAPADVPCVPLLLDYRPDVPEREPEHKGNGRARAHAR